MTPDDPLPDMLARNRPIRIEVAVPDLVGHSGAAARR